MSIKAQKKSLKHKKIPKSKQKGVIVLEIVLLIISLIPNAY